MKNSDSKAIFPCPRCGNEGQLSIGQSFSHLQLRWYESVNCTRCGLRTEADGIGFPSNVIREQILSASGYWKLILTKVKSTPITAKILSEHLSLGTREALSALKESTDKGIFIGTKAEAMWLADLMKRAGEDPDVFRLD